MHPIFTNVLLTLVVATILAVVLRGLWAMRNQLQAHGHEEFWGFVERKFDTLSLLLLLLVLISAALYFNKVITDNETSWLEQTITTVLGAYIGLTQGARQPPSPPPPPKS